MLSYSANSAFYGTNKYDTPRNYKVDGLGVGTLDASRTSNVYGNSNTVQPPATTV